MKVKQSHRLSRRLLAYVIACSSLLAILATLTQLFLIYKQDVSLIRSNVEYIESSYLPSISEAVYRIDDELLITLLDGALNLQDIVYLEVEEHSGDSRFSTSRGDVSSAKDISSQFPLKIVFPNGTELMLGQLHVFASYEGVFARLWSQVIIILLTNITKTLIAGIFIYVIFQSSLSRHLVRIADMVDEMDVRNRDRDFLIDLDRQPPKAGKEDELDQLVSNINSMWVKLFDEIEFRTLSEKHLKESEGRFRKMIEKSPMPIAITDLERKTSLLNDKFTELYGYTIDDLPTEADWWRLAYPDEDYRNEVLAKWLPAAEEAIQSNSVVATQTWKVTTKDQSRKLCEFDMVQLGDIFLTVVNDVTDKNKLQIQLQKAQRLEAIGTLAGGIAHDFNNILAVITGQAELMALTDLKLGSRADSRVKEIIKAAERAKNLIRQILDISRHNMVANVPVDLVPLVKETVKFVRASAPAGIKISDNINVGKVVVLSDTSRMHQVLLNLCTNAIQAMKEENGELKVGLDQITLDKNSLQQYEDLAPGPYVKITVSDTGIGIPTDLQEQIFNPYFTTKGISGGTGLGLAVVHGIIKSHHGNISIYSEIGRGTTFSILLPRIEDAVAESNVELEKILEQGSETILLVDDNQQLLDTASDILENLGYQVFPYGDPQMALDAFSEEPEKFDLVLTDFSMPKLNGRELFQELKNVQQHIKVVLCSGFGENISEDTAEQEGFSAFLAKPFETYILARTIRDVLGRAE